MSVLVPISGALEAARAPEALCSFRRSDGRERSWAQFGISVAAARAEIRSRGAERWVLYCEDCYVFDIALSALLREGRTILVPGGAQAALVAAIRGEDSALVGDGSFDPLSGPSLDLRAIAQAPPSAAPPALGPSRSSEASLSLFTSGSTGEPKAVPKRLGQIEAEIATLHELWGPALEGRAIFSTVSHQHIYGLLFFALLPICSGTPFCSERLAYPESIAELGGRSSALVASPAFLKRAVEARIPPLPAGREALVFSSGGNLPEEIGRAAKPVFGADILEIYGSSETGGIAYRRSGLGDPYRPFAGIQVGIAEDGRIRLRSPYLAESGFITIDDLGEISADGGLRLLGRADSVVKIEEKRVSLAEVEARIALTGLSREARALALESAGRQVIGVALSPSEAGRAILVAEGRHALVARLREQLSAYFAPVLLPRKWRFVDALPANEQGKVLKENLARLFRGKEPPFDLLASRISGSSFELEMCFPAECPYFEGHFPTRKILPAVAQIDIVMRLASERLGASLALAGIPRVKFQKPMSPFVAYVLAVRRNASTGSLEFSFKESGTDIVCSSGRLVLGAAG
jgi:acyl-coenzyme A synthetase/AMP-(fatty) acid ligase